MSNIKLTLTRFCQLIFKREHKLFAHVSHFNGESAVCTDSFSLASFHGNNVSFVHGNCRKDLPSGDSIGHRGTSAYDGTPHTSTADGTDAR